MGAMVDLNSIDASNDNDPFADGLTDPALAGHQDELLRLQEEYAERQRILDQMREADLISFEQYQERLTALQEAGAAERADLERRAYATQMGAAASAFDSIAGITREFAGEQSGIYKAMFAISKAFAIAESVINIQRAMAQALALPFPANIPAMATVAAEGASIVAAIQSVANTGFRSGGYTGDMPEHAVAGVVHGQEWVLDAQATRSIGRANLEYMSRTGRMPANDRSAGGNVVHVDMTNSLITREAFEDLQAGLSGMETRINQSEADLPSKVREIRREDQERGFG
jgi:Skp family chaperone for outer membrane proteins